MNGAYFPFNLTEFITIVVIAKIKNFKTSRDWLSHKMNSRKNDKATKK